MRSGCRRAASATRSSYREPRYRGGLPGNDLEISAQPSPAPEPMPGLCPCLGPCPVMGWGGSAGGAGAD